MKEPACAKGKDGRLKQHAWGVWQQIDADAGYQDCNRRDCYVRRMTRADINEFTVLCYFSLAPAAPDKEEGR